MAEKEEKRESSGLGGKEGEVSKPVAKKSPIKLILIIVGVLIIAGGGFIVWKNFFSHKSASPQAVEGEKKENENEVEKKHSKENKKEPVGGGIITMDPFIVNITVGPENHYLKVNMSVEVNNVAVAEEIKRQNAKIRDLLLTLLGSKSFEDIRSVEGKLSLKEEIIGRINSSLTSGEVTAIYFSEFVMQ